MTPVLDARTVTKTFGDAGGTTVLDGVSFTLSAGEFVAVMGQSGSGKSTLLYTVSGMDRLTAGHVLLDGTDLAERSEPELADLRLHRMGFVFQNNHLLKNLTIRDNVLLPGLKAGRDRADVEARADALLARMGIDAIADHAIQQVSGGQLQRAAICRALINDPAILFADEPTGALNSRASAEVIDIFNDLNREGTTILMVTHDAKIAARTDRVLYLRDGRLEDELHLGPYAAADARAREERTLTWLLERGF